MVAFVAPVMATPILTRLYSPDDFASAAVFSGLLVTIAGFGSWRLDWMIPNAADEDEAVVLGTAGVAIGVCVAVLSFAILWVMSAYIKGWRGAEVLGGLVFLVPVGLLVLTVRDLLNAWFVRGGDLRAASTGRIGQALAHAGVSVGVGFTAAGAAGLVLGQIAGGMVGVSIMSRAVRRLGATAIVLNRDGMDALRRHISQATLSVAVTVVFSSSQMALPILLIQYFSSTEVGWYSLMQRVALAPLGIITTALGQSFWAEASHLARVDPARLRHLYFVTTGRLLLMSIPLVVLCVCGPLYVGWIFGRDEWAESGYVLQCLAPSVVGTLVFGPLNHLVVHRRQSWQLMADGSRLVLIVAIIICSGALHLPFLLVIFLTSLASLGGYVILFLLHWKILR